MTIEFDRYRAVGLTGNPFSVEMHDSDAGILNDAWFVDRGLAKPPAPASNTLVQVIGDQGVGKSTHLHHWRRRQPGPYHYIPRSPYHRRWHQGPVATMVYGDEIDRMPRLLRRQWFRRLATIEATVVIGTHADLTGLGHRFGFAVRTHWLGPVGRDQLAAVLERRVEAAALPASEDQFRFTEIEISEILAASKGNLRAADTVSHRLVARRLNQRSVEASQPEPNPAQSRNH